MKEAAEWCDEMFGRNVWVMADTMTIEAIQMDAWKQGMTDAIELLERSQRLKNQNIHTLKQIRDSKQSPHRD